MTLVLILGAIVAADELAEASSQPAAAGPSIDVKLGGYVEAYYSQNLASPSNSVNAFRGVDGRSQMVTLGNAVVDVKASLGAFSARVALQAGATPEAYYAAEPIVEAEGGQPAMSAAVWKHIQQATASYVFGVGNGLTLEGGLFLSPVGAESVATKDNWNLSYGTVANALPFFHLGVRANYPVAPGYTLSAFVLNGYGDATDNNQEKTVGGAFVYEPSSLLTLKLVYVSGVERSSGAAEGRAWRHMLDGWFVLRPLDGFELQAHVNGGIEPNAFGTSAWIAAAAFVRVRLISWLFLAARADVFHEKAAPGASFMFLPTATMGSLTATLEARAFEHISLKLEVRRDQADTPIYFGGKVLRDTTTGLAIATLATQHTVSLGVVAWF